MRQLFDSTVLIAHLRGDVAATRLVRSAVVDGAAHASVLSRVEIEGGMRSGERAVVSQLFNAVDLAPVTDSIASAAATFLREYRRAHSGIDIVDYVIAATARHLDADLLTLNVRHFPMFDGLEPAF